MSDTRILYNDSWNGFLRFPLNAHPPKDDIFPVMLPSPYPLLLAPLLLPKVWGGKTLGILQPGENAEGIGEAWLFSCQQEHVSNISNGPLKGASLRDALAAWSEALSGTLAPAGELPLLVKLIDAAENLSVQVHPSHHHLPGKGKEESWLILSASPEGAVYRGFAPGYGKLPFLGALAQGNPEACLNREPLKGLEVLDIPPGTIHAILAGVTLLEVQEPSDVTYRLYDYGRNRPLHVTQGEAALQENPPPPVTHAFEGMTATVWGARQRLIHKPAYQMEALSVTDTLTLPPLPATFRVLVGLDVQARTTWSVAGSQPQDLPGWQALVIPAQGPGLHLHAPSGRFVLSGLSGTDLLTGATA